MDLRRMMAAVGHDSAQCRLTAKTDKLIEVFPDGGTEASINRAVVKTILSNSFGAEGEDSYYTDLFLNAAASGRCFDCIAMAICNHAILELTYQTRFLSTGSKAEVAVYVGRRSDFPIAMAHHNVVFGLLINNVGAQAFVTDERDKDYLAGLLEPKNLAEGVVGAQSEIFDINHRTLVGCVVFDLDVHDGDHFNSAHVLDYCRDYLHAYTTYIIFGSAAAVLNAAFACEFSHPEAHILIKMYGEDATRALIMVQGIKGNLNIEFSLASIERFKFIHARALDKEIAGICAINYRADDIVWPKPPLAIHATGVLTEETRRHTSAPQSMYHDIVMVKDGILVPCISHQASTILIFSPRGFIICDYGNEEGALRQTSFWTGGTVLPDGSRMCEARLENVIKIKGPAFPLQFAPYVHHWFSHFIIQCVPRILVMEAIGVPQASIIVPATLRKKQFEMLIHAGIREDRIVKIPEDACCQADEMYVPRAWPLVFSPFTIPVFDRIRRSLNIETRRPSERLLISRAMRKTWRNMLNGQAIVQMLVDDMHFKLLKPENLSLADEVTLFHNAKTVIGAEGAGLYGGVYAQQKSNFISITDDDYSMPILGSIATQKGFDVFYVFGESFQSAQDLRRRLPYGHTDFVIDPTSVQRMVRIADEKST